VIGWLAQLRATRSPRELCELTRYFIAHFTPQEMATVPGHCWPRVKAPDDIPFWQDRLATEFCKDPYGFGPSDAHRKLVEFFSAAGEHLAALNGVACNDEEADKTAHNGS